MIAEIDHEISQNTFLSNLETCFDELRMQEMLEIGQRVQAISHLEQTIKKMIQYAWFY